MATADDVLSALTAYNLRAEGHGKYRFNSPLRAGADGMTCTLTLTPDGEHGAWIDHKSNECGSLYNLAQHLGVSLPDRAPVATTKRAYGGLADYAEAHGVPPEELKRWGWTECIYTDAGKQRTALTYPTRSGKRWRYIDGNKPYYKSEKGYKQAWYGLNKEVAERLALGVPLIICNGEISTIAAQWYGMAAISLPGGEKNIPEEHIQSLRAWLHEAGVTPSIVVAMDCDHTGRVAARGIVATLRTAGFQARAVDLKLSAGGDLADYCRLHGIHAAVALEALPDVEDEREPLSNASWKRVDLDGVLAQPLIDWIIPHIIPKEGLCVVYGPSGTHKSFYCLHLALNVAMTHPICYVAAEGQLGYRQRVEAWIQHHAMRPPRGNAQFILGSINLFDRNELENLRDDLASVKPVMIIVDTLAMVSGDADENSTRDMNRIVNGCKWLAEQTGAAIVLVHHTSQEGRVERGSKALRGAAHTMIRLSQMDEYLTVECTKAKDTSQFRRRYMAPVQVVLPYMTTLGEHASSLVLVEVDAARVESGVESNLTELQMNVLREVQVESDARVSDISYRLERNPGVISTVLRKLVSRGYLVQDGSRRSLTDKALKALADAALIDSADSGDSSPADTTTNSTSKNNVQVQELPESSRIKSTRLMAGFGASNHYTGGF